MVKRIDLEFKLITSEEKFSFFFIAYAKHLLKNNDLIRIILRDVKITQEYNENIIQLVSKSKKDFINSKINEEPIFFRITFSKEEDINKMNIMTKIFSKIPQSEVMKVLIKIYAKQLYYSEKEQENIY